MELWEGHGKEQEEEFDLDAGNDELSALSGKVRWDGTGNRHPRQAKTSVPRLKL